MTKEEKEYISQWLFRANEDIAVISALSNQDIEHYTSSICFHCQQAVEKFFKAFLVFHNKDFPKTHDVDYLLKKCIEIKTDTFEGIDLKNLSDFGVTVRYADDFFIPELSETKEYIDIAFSIKDKL